MFGNSFPQFANIQKHSWFSRVIFWILGFVLISVFKYEIADYYWLVSRPIIISKPKAEVCTGQILKPKRLRSFDIERAYPKNALINNIEGRISFDLLVNEKGLVEHVSVLNSVPAGVFDAHASVVAKKLVFVPSFDNCKAVKSNYGMTLIFKLG